MLKPESIPHINYNPLLAGNQGWMPSIGSTAEYQGQQEELNAAIRRDPRYRRWAKELHIEQQRLAEERLKAETRWEDHVTWARGRVPQNPNALFCWYVGYDERVWIFADDVDMARAMLINTIECGEISSFLYASADEKCKLVEDVPSKHELRCHVFRV